MQKFKILFFLSISLILQSPAFLNARGLSTTFASVKVDNLKIGQTYSIKELINYPLKVSYNDDPEAAVGLKIDVQIPQESEIKEEDKQQGFEPIPDTSWIKLEKDFFALRGGETASSDIIISIPYDIRYLGKKYQVYFWSHTVPLQEGGFGLAVGLRSKLFITIDENLPEIKTETEQSSKDLLPAAYFSLSPQEIYLKNVPLGQVYDVKKNLGKSFSLKNEGKITYTYQLSICSPEELNISIPEGYQNSPVNDFIQLKEDKVKVKPGKEKEIRFFVNIPKKDEYAGKNYMFVIKTEALNTEVPVITYTRIYLSVEQLEEKNLPLDK